MPHATLPLALAQRLRASGALLVAAALALALPRAHAETDEAWRLEPEFSVAWLADRRLAFGAEYRRKPDNLNPSVLGAGLKEDDWWDLFAAWAPTKHFSLTAAYVQLGHIVPAVATKRQDGGYLSAQIAL